MAVSGVRFSSTCLGERVGACDGFSVLPASCRQNQTMRDRTICRRDAGSTLDRHHEAPLSRYGRLRWDSLVTFVQDAQKFSSAC